MHNLFDCCNWQAVYDMIFNLSVTKLICFQATDFKWDGEDNVFNEVFIKRNMEQLKLTFAFFYEVSLMRRLNSGVVQICEMVLKLILFI